MRSLLTDYIFGHDWAVDLLAQAMDLHKIPQSLLITGMPQIGKATLARAFSLALNCQSDAKPCGQCASCRKAFSGNHPDITILDETQESLKIEQIRNLQRNLSLRPHESQYKIAVLCNFERATTGAANALLKTLEEPPSYGIIILTAQSNSLLLPTIVSRCQIINLRPTTDKIVAKKLKTHWRASTGQADLLSRLAQGRLGWAVQALQNPDILSLRDQYLSDLLALIANSYAFRLAYAQTLSKKDTPLTQLLNLWLLWWRDVLLLNRNANTEIVNVDYVDKIQWLAQTLSIDKIMAAINQTSVTLKNLEYNVNTRLNLEVLLLNLPYLQSHQDKI